MTLQTILTGIAIAGATPAAGLAHGAVKNYKSHDPARIEQRRADWIFGPELAEPSPPVNWKQFEVVVDNVLSQARDPYAINAYSLLESFEEGTFDQRKLIDHIDHRGWRCASCGQITEARFFQCQACGNGFRGGGPFAMTADNGAVFTNETDKVIATSLGTRIEPGEAYGLQLGEIVRDSGKAAVPDPFDAKIMTDLVTASTRSKKESGPTDSKSARPEFSPWKGSYICTVCGTKMRHELTHCPGCNERIHWR